MKLNRVTFTGADNSVDCRDLCDLSRDFPFVEWGILVSASNHGCPRFPSHEWVRVLQDLALEERFQDDDGNVNLSLHICGRWVRSMLIGTMDLPVDLFAQFQRVQLNFSEQSPCDEVEFRDTLRQLGKRHIIFQVAGLKGRAYLDYALDSLTDCVPLFDASGGAGVCPPKWPEPILRDGESLMYHGYAGGLGPDNLAHEIPRIAKAAGDARVWLDMESGVRSNNDKQFDLDKVLQCLEIAKPFVRCSR